MARQDEFKSASKNPASSFLEWKSDDKCFSFYDKEKGENTQVKLPFKFLVLKQMNTIRGWDDKNQSGIYSNEVAKISEEPITVKNFKGGQIAKGLYRDIKSTIVDAGGHYSRSIYVMTERGALVNINLKGASVQAWGDFTQKTLDRLSKEWVSVTSANEATKGKVTYSTPNFEFAGTLSTDKASIADKLYDELVDYFKGGKAAVEHETISEVIEEQSDLPF